MEPCAGEDIHEGAALAGGVGDAIGGHEGEAEGGCEVAEGFEFVGFVAVEVALQFDVDAVGSEGVDELGGGFAGLLWLSGGEGAADGAIGIAGEGDEAFREFREVVPAGGGGESGAAEFCLGEEAAEVAVPGTVGDEQREGRTVGEGEFAADEGADAVVATSVVQARRAVHAVAVAERECGQAEGGGLGGEVLRQAATAEKAERAPGVQFDVARGVSHIPPPVASHPAGAGVGRVRRSRGVRPIPRAARRGQRATIHRWRAMDRRRR